MTAPASSAWLLVAAGCFGWVWGSFLNTIVDRTPRRDGSGAGLGWFSPPRSVCLGCGTPIPWWDNVPVASYILLRGRCRSCGASIGLRTLVVELATPVAFLVLAWVLNPGQHLVRFAWWAGVLSVALVTVPSLLEWRRLQGAVIAWGLLAVAGSALFLS